VVKKSDGATDADAAPTARLLMKVESRIVVLPDVSTAPLCAMLAVNQPPSPPGEAMAAFPAKVQSEIVRLEAEPSSAK
jgi:hypothetical protein